MEKESVRSGSFEFLPDSHGEDGDVRDIVITSASKTFGISCKTNHSAYKHSRLSDRVNFVEKWGLDGSGCSATYLAVANSIFGKLREIKTSSGGTALWRDEPDIPNDYYWPILDAFEVEVKRVESPQMCARFIRYLIGSHDFYKVISRTKAVEITAFNINKTLSIPPIKLPDKITGSRRNNGSQYARTIIRFNRPGKNRIQHSKLHPIPIPTLAIGTMTYAMNGNALWLAAYNFAHWYMCD